jgi:hypothetical protein
MVIVGEKEDSLFSPKFLRGTSITYLAQRRLSVVETLMGIPKTQKLGTFSYDGRVSDIPVLSAWMGYVGSK